MKPRIKCSNSRIKLEAQQRGGGFARKVFEIARNEYETAHKVVKFAHKVGEESGNKILHHIQGGELNKKQKNHTPFYFFNYSHNFTFFKSTAPKYKREQS